MDKRNETCSNCRFWVCDYFETDEYDVPVDYGECHRFPPKAVGPEGTAHPITADDDWCGEFDS